MRPLQYSGFRVGRRTRLPNARKSRQFVLSGACSCPPMLLKKCFLAILPERRAPMSKSSAAEQIKTLASRMDVMEQQVGNALQVVTNQQNQLGQVLSAHGLLPASQAPPGRRPESLHQLVKRIVPELSVQQ